MKVVVTGAGGFIGSHMLERLEADARVSQVFAVDRKPLEEWQSRLVDPAKTVLGSLNLFNPRSLAGVFQALGDPSDEEDVVVVVHLAATLAEGTERTEVVSNNVNATLAVLALTDALQNKGWRTAVLHASSAAVYGNVPSGVAVEGQDLAPVDRYGMSKVLVENLLNDVDGRGDLTLGVVNLRLANVYGPGQEQSAESGVIGKWMLAARDGGMLTLHGDGSQIRDFVYVGDVVESFARLASLAEMSEPPVFEWNEVNVSTGKPTTLMSLVTLLASVKEIRLRRTDSPVGVQRSVLGTHRREQWSVLAEMTPLMLGLTATWQELISE